MANLSSVRSADPADQTQLEIGSGIQFVNCRTADWTWSAVLSQGTRPWPMGCVFVAVVDLLRYQVKAVEIWSV